MSGDDLDRGGAKAERVGEEGLHGFVGFAFFGGSGNGDLERVAMGADDARAPGAGLDVDRQEPGVAVAARPRAGRSGRVHSFFAGSAAGAGTGPLQ